MGKVTKMFPMIKLTFGALLLLAVTDIGEAKPRNIHIHLYGVQMWNPGTGSYPREGGSDYSDDSEEEDEEADEEKEKEDEDEDTEEDADEDAKKEGSDEKSKESSEEEPKEEEAGDDYSNGRFGTGLQLEVLEMEACKDQPNLVMTIVLFQMDLNGPEGPEIEDKRNLVMTIVFVVTIVLEIDLAQ